ncbi:NAD(P)/FAD-dependent oxidoreductase [Allopusillimonas ginsengisoli]|uniref:NAD(P)/FAD-dependent oxidoreductase n=1 Tax=Allopusillimonas ginsengisoli TaxID=453575 RepID=UPI001FD6891D
MMAAAVAGQRGLRVVLIDHASRLAEKIRISGGGRCNFTNIGAGPANFISQNPNFCRSALAGYTPRDFIDLVKRHGIAWHEKHKGQLFCDESSEQIIAMLQAECDAGRVKWKMPCTVQSISRASDHTKPPAADALSGANAPFVLDTSQGEIAAHQLVLATGGMAIPQLGATDFALGIARQFGLKVVEPRPALVPLTFDTEAWKPFATLSGVALDAEVSVRHQTEGKKKAATTFYEDLLFTHRGLSGPAILQISTFWNPGQPLQLNLAPGQDMEQLLLQAKSGNRQQLGTVLSGLWPKRLAEQWLQNAPNQGQQLDTVRMADAPDKLLRSLAHAIHNWTLTPSGTAGYKKAEVMRGGVDTRSLNQKTMEVKTVPGLYFIGEAVDVTGWLGGYNFQWAWASGAACGRALQQH